MLSADFQIRYHRGATIQFSPNTTLLRSKVCCLLGSSGSGKSSVLRCLAGLQQPSLGRIAWNDETWFDSESRTSQTPQQRMVRFVQQGQLLFPHRDVLGNLRLAAQAIPRQSRDSSIDQSVQRFGIGAFLRRRVSQLSGGEKQRVILAQCLLAKPKILLLDEPLQSLDTSLRSETRAQMRSWIDEFACPTILVSHDIADAIAIADELVVLDQGKVVQWGQLRDVLEHPANEAVSRLLRPAKETA